MAEVTAKLAEGEALSEVDEGVGVITGDLGVEEGRGEEAEQVEEERTDTTR